MSSQNLIQTTLHDVTLKLILGDSAAQKGFHAVVNAANAEVTIGGGVSGALHRVADPGLEEEAVPPGPIRPGEAVRHIRWVL